MSETKAQKRKRKKQYYMNSSGKRKKEVLDKDMKGFLITCNDRERQCVHEAYSLLGEFADRLYGPEKTDDNDEKPVDAANDDIEAEISKEINYLKNSSKSERRFQEVNTNSRNCLFIKTLVPDPCQLVYTIFKEIQSQQLRKTRFMLRLIPVLATCRAHLPDIKKLAENVLPEYFENTSPGGLKFAIMYKSRNNSEVRRADVISTVASVICTLDSANKVDLDSPQLAVLVEIVCKICCFSVVTEFSKLMRYNISEIVFDGRTPIQKKAIKMKRLKTEHAASSAAEESNKPTAVNSENDVSLSTTAASTIQTGNDLDSINDKIVILEKMNGKLEADIIHDKPNINDQDKTKDKSETNTNIQVSITDEQSNVESVKSDELNIASG